MLSVTVCLQVTEKNSFFLTCFSIKNKDKMGLMAHYKSLLATYKLTEEPKSPNFMPTKINPNMDFPDII